jgi:predicted CoA-binding protein
MPYQITGERLTSLFRPRSVALVGASDKSVFSQIAYHNLVEFGFADHTYLVSRRGTQTHGQPTVTSCAQIGEPVDVAYLMVPQAGLLEALDDAAAAGIRNACVLSSGYAEAGSKPGRPGRARRPRGRARHGAARPEPPRLRQPHRRRAGLLYPGLPPKAARWRCSRRAGPVRRPWWTSPGWSTSACPTWSRSATRR